MPVTTIEWSDGQIRIIDQTRLPSELVYVHLGHLDAVVEAIRNLRVRGAPAIGIAAAFGAALAMRQFSGYKPQAFLAELDRVTTVLQATRPTAVNLSWALARLRQAVMAHREPTVDGLKSLLVAEAQKIWQEDREICRAIGWHGSALVPNPANVITHCNTGALAAADFGTALGILFTAHSQGKKLHVYVDETRPLLQGARLSMWELMQEGVACTLICDGAAAFVMQRHRIDLCIVGADRIARNGDTANKVGTYSLAVNADRHGIPFYVAAPTSTVDFATADGGHVPIEERSAEEIAEGFGHRIAPPGARAYNPAFDVTPHGLITAIITEKGVLRPPLTQSLAQLEK